MTEKRYSNREINGMLQRIEEKVEEHFESSKESHASLREHMDAGFGRVETKQDYTNGRVRLLEKLIWSASGAVVILSIVFGWWFKDYISFRDQRQSAINEAVDRAFETYLELQGYELE